MQLPNRVFNSPLIQYANFIDGTFVNLIKLNKPYKSGISYAVYAVGSMESGLFKSYAWAKKRFQKILNDKLETTDLLNSENKI